MSDRPSSPNRAVFRNALTWAAAWAVAGGALTATLALFSPDPSIESLPERIGLAIIVGLEWGVRFGLVGAVIGAAFATAIRLTYRGRRLAEINPFRFAILGAVVGGAGVPLYLQMMNVLSGTGLISWSLVTDDAVWATIFGGAVAGGSILLARRAATQTGPAALDGLHATTGIPPEPFRHPSLTKRNRAPLP